VARSAGGGRAARAGSSATSIEIASSSATIRSTPASSARRCARPSGLERALPVSFDEYTYFFQALFELVSDSARTRGSGTSAKS